MGSLADCDEQKLISSSWVVEVQKLLKAPKEDEGKQSLAGRAIKRLRLPKALVDAKAEAYTPQIVSLGPLHHRTLKDVCTASYLRPLSDLSLMEMYKVESARSAADYKPALMEKLHRKITEESMIHKLEVFYDCKIGQEYKDSPNFADEEGDEAANFGWMMMVDSLFLFRLLKEGLTLDTSKLYNHPAMASIRCDILKLENQIPLFLLKDAGSTLQKNEIEDSVRTRISSTELSSFEVQADVDTEKIKNEDHLLGCMHAYVSSFLQIDEGREDSKPNCYQKICTFIGDIVAAIFGIFCPHPVKRGRQDFLDKYNAKELVKSGIKFKGYKGAEKIRFDKYSDTLFLPRIMVSDAYTEVVLRNLLALEFNDVSRPKAVTNYVELMDCLIDTPEDVKLLRDSGVIDRRSMMITDEYVTNMWDGMCKPFFANLLEPPASLKNQIKQVLIKNYYKRKIKTAWREFREQHISRPWQVVALIVAIFVVVLDTLQTYCEFTECKVASGRRHLSTFH